MLVFEGNVLNENYRYRGCQGVLNRGVGIYAHKTAQTKAYFCNL